MSPYIEITEDSVAGHTKRHWVITAVKSREIIGAIQWNTIVKDYVFYPEEKSFWTKEILSDVLQFITTQAESF